MHKQPVIFSGSVVDEWQVQSDLKHSKNVIKNILIIIIHPFLGVENCFWETELQISEEEADKIWSSDWTEETESWQERIWVCQGNLFKYAVDTRLNIFVIFTSDILCWACSRILIRFIIVFLPVIWREFPRVHSLVWMDRLNLRTSHQVHQIQECRASVNQGQFD